MDSLNENNLKAEPFLKNIYIIPRDFTLLISNTSINIRVKSRRK